MSSIKELCRDTKQGGSNGAYFASETTRVDGNFSAITVLEDCVFNGIVSNNWSFTNPPIGLSVKAGTTIYGKFLAFQLTSGKVVAYKT
jgi:hypothetical protein